LLVDRILSRIGTSLFNAGNCLGGREDDNQLVVSPLHTLFKIDIAFPSNILCFS